MKKFIFAILVVTFTVATSLDTRVTSSESLVRLEKYTYISTINYKISCDKRITKLSLQQVINRSFYLSVSVVKLIQNRNT